MEERFKRFVINYYGDLPKVLEGLDTSIGINGTFFCPMHDNFNTPAAKIFKDKDGWHFFCFAEQKQFGTYDVYKDVYGYNMNQVFYQLWNHLDDSQKQEVQELYGEVDNTAPITNIDTYYKFKYGKLSYTEFIHQLKTDLLN